MTTTTNLAIKLMEVSQGAKETTFNDGMAVLDAKVPVALADAASDPATSGKAPGSTYYNTTSKVVKILRVGGIWSVANGYLGEFASDPATTSLQAGSTYFNTATSKLKVLKSDAAWVTAA